MKIVNLAGGLGNQMFQYAFALSLKEKFKDEDIKIDISTFSGLKIVRQYELANVFDVRLPIADEKDLRKVTFYFRNYRLRLLVKRIVGRKKTVFKEPRLFTYWGKQVDAIKGDCYFEGSWQNEAYFKECASLIRDAFIFKNELDVKNKRLLEEIRACDSVSIHVRRGDYLSIPYYQNICDEPYYTNAIDYIKKHIRAPHFFIFSTDIEWCNENIVPLINSTAYTLVDWNVGNESYKDMQLMSHCKHNIIAHSSFSWWAAWLNKNNGKIVIAPKEWFRREDITDKPQLDSWILMANAI